MPILENLARNALADGLGDAVDVGSGNGSFVLETSADAEVATFDLGANAFGSATAGVIAASGVPIEDEDAAGGTVAQASLYNGNDAKLLEATAGTVGTEVIVSSTTVGAGETVTLTSLTITVPDGS